MPVRESYALRRADRPARGAGDGGLTLVEVTVSIFILTTGLLALAGVLSVTSQQDSRSAQRVQVLNRAQTVIEGIKETDPATVAGLYHGQSYTVAGVNGGDGVITVEVDDSNPELISVTLTATWTELGQPESLSFGTMLYGS